MSSAFNCWDMLLFKFDKYLFVWGEMQISISFLRSANKLATNENLLNDRKERCKILVYSVKLQYAAFHWIMLTDMFSSFKRAFSWVLLSWCAYLNKSKIINGGSGVCFRSQWQRDSQLLSLHKHILKFFTLKGTFFSLSLVNMTLMVSVFLFPGCTLAGTCLTQASASC